MLVWHEVPDAGALRALAGMRLSFKLIGMEG